jgi:hypothetical protein
MTKYICISNITLSFQPSNDIGKVSCNFEMFVIIGKVCSLGGKDLNDFFFLGRL